VQFDFVNWISLALVDEAHRRWAAQPVGSLAQQRATVQTYLDLESERQQLEQEITRLYAQNNAAAAAEPEARQADIRRRQADIAPQVETIIARQIETVLAEEGFTLGGYVMPPVAFRLIEPPTTLIISPRDKIERQNFMGLDPGLSVARRTQIEDTLQQRGDVSAYVTDVGGLGSYPTMVANSSFLPWLIDATAHEWTHNYLYTFPTAIAWGYGDDHHLTTVNETTASLVGEEISRKVITRFYPNWVAWLPPLNAEGKPARAPSEFQLAMRQIRLHVDALLADGKIEEAERYMEAERVKLVAQGHNLRRLNQAYFAFHGSYALSPSSPDPTGAQLRQLREASGTLRTFLNRVGWLNSEADYLNWLAEENISAQ